MLRYLDRATCPRERVEEEEEEKKTDEWRVYGTFDAQLRLCSIGAVARAKHHERSALPGALLPCYPLGDNPDCPVDGVRPSSRRRYRRVVTR